MRSHIAALVLASLILAGASCNRHRLDHGELINGDLRNGERSPHGWQLSTGTQVRRDRWPRFLEHGLAFSLGPGQPGDAVAVLSQDLGAARLRGHRIRLTAEGKVEAGTDGRHGVGRFYLRVERPEGQEGFFDNLQGRELREASWNRASIVGDVAQDATRISLGAFLEGPGWFRVRRFRLEDLGPVPSARDEPPRALDAHGLANLEAVARTLGYLRYFHPSDEAARADWNRLAVQGVRTAELAGSPVALARALEATFGPVAPAARFLAPGDAGPSQAPPPAGAQLVGWRHHGPGLPPQGVYRSVRMVCSLSQLPPGWGARLDPLRLAVGRGVVLMLPTLVQVGSDGRTLPRAQPDAAGPGRERLPEPTVFTGSAEDRSTRLATVCLAWCGPQHFYPWFGDEGMAWSAALKPALQRAALDPGGPALLATLNRLNAVLKDGHGRIYPPWPPDQVPQVSVVFLGDRPFVRATGDGIPELVRGSEILSVDGEPVAQVIKRIGEGISSPGPAWMRARLARDLLAGRPGGWVRVQFRRPDGSVTQLNIQRTQPPAMVRCLGLPAPMAELRPGVWYLDLERLDDHAFETWVIEHGSSKGVVLDFRGYPATSATFLGHLLDREVPGIPVQVPVVEMPDRKDWTWDETDRARLEPRIPRITGRVVCLADSGSASYPESCLAAIRTFRLGTLVGAKTAGVNGQLAAIPLPCGLTQQFTGMRAFTYEGEPFNGVGVAPDLPVPATLRGLREGRDEPLERALALLLGGLSGG